MLFLIGLNRTSIIDIFNNVIVALKSPRSRQMYLCENLHQVACADVMYDGNGDLTRMVKFSEIMQSFLKNVFPHIPRSNEIH